MLLRLILASLTPFFCLCTCKVMKVKSKTIGWSLMWVQGLAFLGFWMWTGNFANKRKKREWWSSIQEAESETGPNLWLFKYTNGVNIILFSSPFSHSPCFKLVHKILLHVISFGDYALCSNPGLLICSHSKCSQTVTISPGELLSRQMQGFWVC